jgi:hypothetical protein
MANEKDSAPQQPQQPVRIREAGNVEKRGGWMKPTAPPSAMSRPQGMPDKPQGNASQGGGGQGSSGEGQ